MNNHRAAANCYRELHTRVRPKQKYIIQYIIDPHQFLKKMVRAPCCEKMGLKKGPWTPEEDQILMSYIQKHGHGNWRALPKLAGLLRCGKSCRLRWINYLRPDIKRGNFSSEEEEIIIKMHELLGNRYILVDFFFRLMALICLVP